MVAFAKRDLLRAFGTQVRKEPAVFAGDDKSVREDVGDLASQGLGVIGQA
jgi:hypothetical protein